MGASVDMDHYAISPLGWSRSRGRVVLRVLVYRPRMDHQLGLRVRIQACEPSGTPIAEDPLVALERVPPEEVQEFLRASRQDGWTFLPRKSDPRVSS